MPEQLFSLPHAAEASFLHRGLGHVEFFDYPRNEMARLKKTYRDMANKGQKGLSFHAPMPRPAFFPYSGVTCFFLNEEPALRELSFQLLEDTLQHAQAWEADYIVTHLTYGKTDTTDPEKATSLAQDSCDRFATLSRKYDVPVNIEFAAYSTAFHEAERFVELVSQYEELGICIDTGHTMFGAQMHQRDYFDDISKLASQARSMHLWNTRCDVHDHIPLHPSQSPQEGWIDMERTLKIVFAQNPDSSIVFEYPIVNVTPAIQEGYDWIENMIKTINYQTNHK
ncbi:MAG: sugar phosphate isomerase/epimerase [Proteobacteria bacterium]|nr:sugar phosphate isomerase/epimerase [Pseudomonadota bacterium]NOG59326.1 sugar phosphate isomerase/epimerase [Pseudomonadota bacterium]